MSNKNSLEQEMREAIHVFLQDNSPASLIRKLHNGEDVELSSLWQEIHNMGLGIITVPDSMGGIGLGMLAAVELAEEIGMSLLPLPLSTCVALAPVLFAKYDQANKDSLVDEIYQGKHFVSLFHPWDKQKLRADYIGKDTIAFNIDGNQLNIVSSSAQPKYGIDKSISFVVAQSSDIIKQKPVCKVTDSDVDHLKNSHRLMLMGELLGVASQSLKLAIEYACEREQFGKPIGSNQALKHNLADQWMAIDNARLAIHKAALSLDENSESLSFDLDAAQYLMVIAGKSVTSYAKQVYGAMGITWECDIHLYLKRSRYLCAQLEQNKSQGLILNSIWESAV